MFTAQMLRGEGSSLMNEEQAPPAAPPKEIRAATDAGHGEIWAFRLHLLLCSAAMCL